MCVCVCVCVLILKTYINEFSYIYLRRSVNFYQQLWQIGTGFIDNNNKIITRR